MTLAFLPYSNTMAERIELIKELLDIPREAILPLPNQDGVRILIEDDVDYKTKTEFMDLVENVLLQSDLYFYKIDSIRNNSIRIIF